MQIRKEKSEYADMINCPFCLKGAAESYLESVHCRVIYNISPILPGHSLVIPKRHCESLFELSSAEITDLFLLATEATGYLLKLFNTKAFNMAIQEGTAAGQSQAHVHLHLVPRTPDDLPDPGAWYAELNRDPDALDTFSRKRLSGEQLAEVTSRLKHRIQLLKSGQSGKA